MPRCCWLPGAKGGRVRVAPQGICHHNQPAHGPVFTPTSAIHRQSEDDADMDNGLSTWPATESLLPRLHHICWIAPFQAAPQAGRENRQFSRAALAKDTRIAKMNALTDTPALALVSRPLRRQDRLDRAARAFLPCRGTR
jgi:hypothetical protein